MSRSQQATRRPQTDSTEEIDLATHLRDAIISIPSAHSAQLESWLLGHGFPVNHQQSSEDGATTFYAVKEITVEQRDDAAKLGAEVASAWKPGEVQTATE
jgi:hypothetical protein